MKQFARSVLSAGAARFSAATAFLLVLLWLVAQAQTTSHVDQAADTNPDCWLNNADATAPSRVVIYWGDSRYTQGDTYDSPEPAWWLGAEKLDGEWTNCSWHVPASERSDVGRTRVYLDRNLLTNDVMMTVLLFDHTNASLFVDLLDSNAVVVATNLYDNLLAGSNEAIEVQVTVPLTNYPTASTIQLRRGVGEVTVYRSVLDVNDDQNRLGADRGDQADTSKLNTSSGGNGSSGYNTRSANASRGAIKNLAELVRGESLNEQLGGPATRYVDSILGDNSFNGLSPVYADGSGPKRNIYAAIAVADSGASILIAAGSYGETNWDAGAKTLTLQPVGNVMIYDTTDSDGDGMPDWWELANGLNPLNSNDATQASTNPWAHGLTNLQVYQHPSVLFSNNYSTLGDGIPDWWRVKYFTDPTDPASVPDGDPDTDGWSNLEEYLNGTNPLQPDGPMTSFDFTVNGGQTYSPSLTVTIQPQSTNYPNILVSLDPSMSDATVLPNSGGPLSYTLSDNGDGGYELFLRYADAQDEPHGPIVSKSVIVDRVPPVVSITSPGSTAVLDQAFITLQAVAYDPNPVLADASRPLSIWINGQPFWDRGGTNIALDLFPVPAGTNSFTVTIQVADQAGHTNQASQTWAVDTSGVTNAPNLLTVNLSSTMLLPDVDSIWVEGDIDNGKARVSALTSSGSGDVSTNALNVWKQHYEGLVPLESGTNQVVLLAADAAGNTSSMFFTIICSTRYQAAITSPAFGDFATAPSNTVSGYVSALFDAGLPTQTNVLGVVINGVAATLHWDEIDENGNVPFDSAQMIPLGVPITGYLVGDGLPTDPAPSLPPAMSQGYEVTHKVEVEDDIVTTYGPCIATPSAQEQASSVDWSRWNLVRSGGCWITDRCGPSLGRELTTVTQDWVEATSQVQSNWVSSSGRPPYCITTLDPDSIPWNMWAPWTDSAAVPGPISRGLSFGSYAYDHGAGLYQELDWIWASNPCAYQLETVGYRALQRQLETSSIRFRAPRQYGTNTTVIFIFEGVDYRRRDGVPLDLSQVEFRGQSPVAYSNETQTVSYLLTVDGGKEYTISESDFQWPADQQTHHESASGHDSSPCPFTRAWWFAGSWTEDMHWLNWTNFHNEKPEIDIVGMNQNAKKNPGGLVVCNCDSNSPPRVQITIQQLTNVNVNIILTIPSQVKVFTASTNGTQVTSGTAFSSAALPTNLWVEGESASSSMMDAKLTVAVSGTSAALDYVNFTVLWGTVSILTSGTTPANAVQFGSAYDGTENLGGQVYAGGTVGVGKVVPIAQLSPVGVNASIKTGWSFRRERWFHTFKDGTQAGINDTAWTDDTSNSQFQNLTPDTSDKIYDRDAPNVASFGAISCTEVYANFHQWVEWNGIRASGGNPNSDSFPNGAEWHWRAKWQASATPNIILKDAGVGYITLPSAAAGCP